MLEKLVWPASAKGKIDLPALSILGAIVILGIGLVLQWDYEFYPARKRGRRHND